LGDITLRVRANMDQAKKAFDDLANSSEATRKKMESFTASFNRESIDNFITRTRELEAAQTAGRGSTVAMENASRSYQREIERLIRQGLDPQSDHVQRLSREQQRLEQSVRDTKAAQEAQKNLMKNAERVFIASKAALAGLAVASLAATKRTASLGIEARNNGKIMGITAEAYQELSHAANMSGVSSQTLKYSFNRLNGELINLRNGNGKLYENLKSTNRELLNGMRNARSSEEAFEIMVGAIYDTECQLERTEMAMQAFGRRAGPEMLLLTSQGAEGIRDLREEARKFGIISNDAAETAVEFGDAQARLHASLQGVATELTSRLMPGMTGVMNNMAGFISSFENWDSVLKVAKYSLIGLTAGMTAFMVVTKGYKMVQKMTMAIKAMNAAIKANPIGFLATVITAILIPAIIFLIRNFDEVRLSAELVFANIQFAVRMTGAAIRQGLVTAVRTVQIAFIELGRTVINAVFGRIVSALNGIGNIVSVVFPNMGQAIKNAASTMESLSDGFNTMADNARAGADEAIASAAKVAYEARKNHRERLDYVRADVEARRAALRAIEEQNERLIQNETNANNRILAAREELAAATVEVDIRTLRQRLNLICKTENQIRNTNINGIKAFLVERAKLESADRDERIAEIRRMGDYLLESEHLVAKERLAINEAVEGAIRALQNDTSRNAVTASQNMMKAYSTFFGGFSQMLKAAGRDNVEFARAGRAVAIVQAGINTALAITKTMSQFGATPVGIAKAIGIGMKGIAQKAKIVSSMIPSAETGGRFQAPQSTGVDNTIMRVNPGETIDVTPRGMTGVGETFNFQLVVDGHVFAEVMNKRARAGELYTLQLATNYQRV